MTAVPQQVIDYLANAAPFDQLDPSNLNALASACSIIYLSEENYAELLQNYQQTLFLIQSGQFSIKDSNGPLRHLSDGDYFGYARLLDEVDYALTISVDSPGLVLCIPKAQFDIALEHPKVSQFFRAAKDDGLQNEAVNDSNSMWLHKPLYEVIENAPVGVAPSDSIQHAAQVMQQHGISSILVLQDSKLVGIVTDRDLRNRVVATGHNAQAAVSEIMTAQPAYLSANKTVFDAVCMMNEKTINHLPLVRQDSLTPVGMVTATDIFKQQRNNVVYVISDISKATSLYELTRCAWQLPHYFASSARRPGDFDIIGKVLSQATDIMTRKLILFFQQQQGQAPMAYCWLVFGSQAREDQTMGSDQDNALLLAREPNAEEADYFKRMAEYVCSGLGKCGIKLCEGNIMASNPALRQSLDAAIEQAHTWVRQPTPEALLGFNIFLDVRGAAGDTALLNELQAARQPLFQQSIFLAALARQANETSVPLSMFQKFVYLKGHSHKDAIDIKISAVAILNNLVRLHALANGIKAPGTISRLNKLEKIPGMSSGDLKNLKDIWLFLNRLRWRHQLTNKVQDNWVRISDLSSIEKHQLKAAFQAIHRSQQAAVLKYSGGIG